MLHFVQGEARPAPEEIVRAREGVVPGVQVIQRDVTPASLWLHGAGEGALARLAGPGDHHHRRDPERLLQARRKHAREDRGGIHTVNDYHSRRE